METNMIHMETSFGTYNEKEMLRSSVSAWRTNAIEVPILDRHFADINPVLFGEEQVLYPTDLQYTMRDCYLLHYVLSGKGFFETPRGGYNVTTGQLFIIHPMEKVRYFPDTADPWHYIWLGITGTQAERLLALPDVLPLADGELFLSMRRCKEMTQDRELFLVARCADLFCHLFRADMHSTRRDYIQYAVHYIGQHYMEQISVEKLANELHIDRHYLTKLFRSECHTSTKAYITKVKMEKARRFLLAGAPVSEAAHYVGFNDILHFSKQYKKFWGESPSATRCVGDPEVVEAQDL